MMMQASDLTQYLSIKSTFKGRIIEILPIKSGRDQLDDHISGPHVDIEKENARVCKENKILREEREIQKKPRSFLLVKNKAFCIH